MERDQYLNFKEKCMDDFQELQEEFKNLYNIAQYSNWYYDHGLGIFTLKNETEAIYFRYVEVGSYSHNSFTWNWSWDNKYTPAKVKKGIEKVLAFGQEHGLEELTTGLYEDEEELGWELTAIANKFINGFGGYRVKSDHLDIYFLFLNEVEAEEYEKLKEKTVLCEEHGSGRIAFVCQHLNKETKTGFEEAFTSWPGMELGEDEEFGAWCDACEQERRKTNGWNEESEKFAGIKLVCENCYFEIKEFNLGEDREEGL